MLNYIKEFFIAPAHSFLIVMLLILLTPTLTLLPFWIAGIVLVILMLLDNLVTNLWKNNNGQLP